MLKTSHGFIDKMKTNANKQAENFSLGRDSSLLTSQPNVINAEN